MKPMEICSSQLFYSGKLPHKLRQNLACEHDSLEWKFQQLREAILKEIRILEAGINVNSPNIFQHGTSSTVTSQFLTQTQGRQPHLLKSNTPAKRKCTYCKSPHPSYYYNVVTDCQQRWSIIKRERLFQLSGEPQVYDLPVKVPLPQMQSLSR